MLCASRRSCLGCFWSSNVIKLLIFRNGDFYHWWKIAQFCILEHQSKWRRHQCAGQDGKQQAQLLWSISCIILTVWGEGDLILYHTITIVSVMFFEVTCDVCVCSLSTDRQSFWEWPILSLLKLYSTGHTSSASETWSKQVDDTERHPSQIWIFLLVITGRTLAARYNNNMLLCDFTCIV